MAGEYFGDKAVVLPNQFASPGDALQSYINNQQRNQEWQYRLQKEREAEDWRKVSLIGDLTDLSKHQTGSDVANALGNRQAAAILQKYSALAPSLSPMELQAKVQQEMSGLITNMDGLQTEMQNADKQLSQLKTLFPDLDSAKLARDYRADILSRRMKTDNEFYNPMEVQPTQMKLDDPLFLSKYVAKNNLSDEFINPKGVDKSTVFIGNPYQYTKYEAGIPYYKKKNFKDEDVKDGFLKSKQNPSLSLRSSIIPSTTIPSSKDKPFEVIDEDVMQKAMESPASQIKWYAAAREKFPQFDKFNDTEKSLALRNVFADYAKNYDKTDFIPTHVQGAPKFIVNPSGSGESKTKNPGADWVTDATNAIHSGDEAKMKDVFALLYGGNTRDKFKSVKIQNGKLYIDYDHVYQDPQTGLDYPAKPKVDEYSLNDPHLAERLTAVYQRHTGSDAKAEDVKRYTQQPTNATSKSYEINGVAYTEKELKGAGWTDAQIEEAIKSKKAKLK